MKFIAFEKEAPGKTKNDFDPYLKPEAKKVWEYYKQGIIREIYFTKENHEAVLILECESKRQAEEILDSFPLVKKNLIAFNVKELVPYDGFERLFNKN